MTASTPDEVQITYFAYPTMDSGMVLPVTTIVASMDRDRVAYTMATLECTALSDAEIAALDPRLGIQVDWRVELRNDSGSVIQNLPIPVFGPGAVARMWVRSIRNDPINNTASIDLAGGESMMVDKKRIAGTNLDPIPSITNVSSLVSWSLIDVFGSVIINNAAVTVSTTIPAGDRRMMLPGESHLDLVQAELDAINCRLLDYWGIQWYTKVRDDVDGTLELSTFEGVSGADPIVYEYTETISRDGDWADGVLVEGDYTNTAGTRVEWWQRSGSGVNTKGVVYSRDRAEPAGNTADEIVTRTVLRGYDIDVTARLFFDFDAYYNLVVYTPLGNKVGTIRAVEWDIGAGEMRIRAQAGVPEE